jgi:hypothetical protein
MSSTPPESESRLGHNVRAIVNWLPLVGSLAVGILGVIVGINQPGTTGGGLSLIAAALAFGLLANAVFRK